MTYCPKCGTTNVTKWPTCWKCGHDISLQVGASREETLRSSDGVAELEAVRERVLALIARKDEWESWELFNLKEASNALRLAAKQKRSRSTTDQDQVPPGSGASKTRETL